MAEKPDNCTCGNCAFYEETDCRLNPDYINHDPDHWCRWFQPDWPSSAGLTSTVRLTCGFCYEGRHDECAWEFCACRPMHNNLN